jgi:propanol-preferring alcohol dehydrogenase
MYAMVLKNSGLALEWTELPHRQPGRREIPVKVVPLALKAVRKGGRVVCAGIHMSDIPSFPYQLLWEERQLVSVANLTRRDGIDFLNLAPEIGVVTETTPYKLYQANRAPADLRAGRFNGAAVLVPRLMDGR